ncbi:hypothetical protein A5320_15045 [Rheinheimera sp. SA_1]|jgi:hypothetical protein|uniref:Uncharacterized protein n=1 Tax=Rheinheimera riviphila TaxID=1834037 RepID=A0A437R4P3_9GAMM|nr:MULTISPECIES: hypothetical protein [Rheinheimera]OBP13983.1 hypothetical protein A5320_15045 [Rheinheimera sp. SA_1]RVU41746.1 hypothetical protein EOE67_00675 [Rheinheimera riviphila]
MATQRFTLDADGNIDSAESSITVQKGEVVTFELENNSGFPVLDWGLYFNNPFSYNQSMRYSFGSTEHNGNLYSAQQTVCTDTDTDKVAMYNAYAIYVLVETPQGQQHIYQKDPEIIVEGGDIII